jgi:hypothetical protein
MVWAIIRIIHIKENKKRKEKIIFSGCHWLRMPFTSHNELNEKMK